MVVTDGRPLRPRGRVELREQSARSALFFLYATSMSPLRALLLLIALTACSAFSLAPRVPALATAAASTTLEGIEMGRGDKRTAKGVLSATHNSTAHFPHGHRWRAATTGF